MNSKLYVGNLDYDVTSEQLGEHFSKAGKVVEANVISDRYSGRSRGFGFVEMANEKDAKAAIEMFNETELNDRKLVVNEARPKKESAPGRSRRPRN